MFQNAFNLFLLFLSRQGLGIPCPHYKLSEKEAVKELDGMNIYIYMHTIYGLHHDLRIWEGHAPSMGSSLPGCSGSS